MTKPHLEFFPIDMNKGWASPPGYPVGIQQKILTSDLDETNKTGSRTRLLRFAPGEYTTAPFVHDHWEEVYLMSGDLIVGNDANGNGGERLWHRPMPAVRPARCTAHSSRKPAVCSTNGTFTRRAFQTRHKRPQSHDYDGHEELPADNS
jgi:hypothetical protein